MRTSIGVTNKQVLKCVQYINSTRLQMAIWLKKISKLH